MPGIEIKGRSKIANYRHGGRTGKFGGVRTNLLEQLGRVEAEPSNRNRRAEISRVHGELNRGYAKGGRAGFDQGKIVRPPKKFEKEKVVGDPTKRKSFRGSPKHRALTEDTSKRKKEKDWADPSETVGGRRIQTKGGPELIPPKRKDDVGVGGYQEPLEHITGAKRQLGVGGREVRPRRGQEGLRTREARRGFKKGGSDKKWIQKAVDPKHKGYCTPMTKKTCTPARKALARTFKKKAKTGWG